MVKEMKSVRGLWRGKRAGYLLKVVEGNIIEKYRACACTVHGSFSLARARSRASHLQSRGRSWLASKNLSSMVAECNELYPYNVLPVVEYRWFEQKSQGVGALFDNALVAYAPTVNRNNNRTRCGNQGVIE